MTTGDRIKQRRKDLYMSAESLAYAVGVSPATIYRYEKGDIEKVPGDILYKIGKALHVSPAYLMGWDNSAPEMPAPEDEQMKEFIRLFGKLTDQQRRSLIALMQSMIAARE